VLRAELEETFADERDALVLAHPGLQRAEEIVVRRVNHRARGVQQRDLVLGLDDADVLHQRLPVDDVDAGLLERAQHRQLDDVHAERLAEQAALLELDADLLGDGLRTPDDGAAQRRDAGTGAVLAEPRVVELVVARSRPEVPHDRVVTLRQQTEADVLVDRPHADVGRRDVADVAHVEAEQRAQLRALEPRLRAREPCLSEAVEVDPLLPVDAHHAVAADSHRFLSR